jgi:hypothetical protein
MAQCDETKKINSCYQIINSALQIEGFCTGKRDIVAA